MFFTSKVPVQIQIWNQILGLGKNIFYSEGVFFLDHWDSVFYNEMETQPFF